MATSSVKDEILQRHLGLPLHVLSTSSLPWVAIDEVCAELRVRPGARLLDLACGRGGYGLEIATRIGARLIGVDFSVEAITQAAGLAVERGVDADFRVGDLSSTGLSTASVDGAVCIDSIQFAERPDAAYAEIRRVLAPGARVVLTCWEPVNRRDERLVGRLCQVDLGVGLKDAGFDGVEVVERPAWRASELEMWEEAASLDPEDDPALQSFNSEAVRVLETASLVRRVMAVAIAPGS
ncbi:MAG: methyltransferase domain-containing protein [Nocardioidaceae bacterium]